MIHCAPITEKSDVFVDDSTGDGWGKIKALRAKEMTPDTKWNHIKK